MYSYRGAICVELFRSDFITLPGKMKCLESRWKMLRHRTDHPSRFVPGYGALGMYGPVPRQNFIRVEERRDSRP